MATLAEPIVHGQPVESGLKTNTLTLFDTTVIATSSVAPRTPLPPLWGSWSRQLAWHHPRRSWSDSFPVLFVAVAYYYLNRQRIRTAEASYSWVSRNLNPQIGWIIGMDPMAATVTVLCGGRRSSRARTRCSCSTACSPAFVTTDAANNNWLIAVVGIAWLLFVTFMVVRGIRITANFQWILVFIEYFIVLRVSQSPHS